MWRQIVWSGISQAYLSIYLNKSVYPYFNTSNIINSKIALSVTLFRLNRWNIFTIYIFWFLRKDGRSRKQMPVFNYKNEYLFLLFWQFQLLHYISFSKISILNESREYINSTKLNKIFLTTIISSGILSKWKSL